MSVNKRDMYVLQFRYAYNFNCAVPDDSQIPKMDLLSNQN